MLYEDFVILELLEKGGHILYHLDDGWRIYPVSFKVSGERILKFESEGWVTKEKIDSESYHYRLAALGKEVLLHARSAN